MLVKVKLAYFDTEEVFKRDEFGNNQSKFVHIMNQWQYDILYGVLNACKKAINIVYSYKC